MIILLLITCSKQFIFFFPNLKFSAVILIILFKTKRWTILILQNQISTFNNPHQLEFGTAYQFNQIGLL
jgi:hypothetical protein